MQKETISVSASILVTGMDSGKLFSIPVNEISEVRKSVLHNGSVIQLDNKSGEKVVRYFTREPFDVVIERIYKAMKGDDA